MHTQSTINNQQACTACVCAGEQSVSNKQQQKHMALLLAWHGMVCAWCCCCTHAQFHRSALLLCVLIHTHQPHHTTPHCRALPLSTILIAMNATINNQHAAAPFNLSISSINHEDVWCLVSFVRQQWHCLPLVFAFDVIKERVQ